jgi:hypothetical protein
MTDVTVSEVFELIQLLALTFPAVAIFIQIMRNQIAEEETSPAFLKQSGREYEHAISFSLLSLIFLIISATLLLISFLGVKSGSKVADSALNGGVFSLIIGYSAWLVGVIHSTGILQNIKLESQRKKDKVKSALSSL